ncbi:hypothetical protein [Pseudomonas pudica]|uniref:Uncharacterized protein n=1 Tax=Pseudomonas pudica TaxID=272772 RepID=A0ABS0FZB8_9PSED|nr:hypothetical protein [Pseudomonas pudica]MBF8645693.1 hypothetical protein [Pseudomonas pudica]MBF8760403.1 hypothetical protein [Pseudomonas pudica]
MGGNLLPSSCFGLLEMEFMKIVPVLGAYAITASLMGCAAMEVKPYQPAPEGVAIVKNQYGSYSVESIRITKLGQKAGADALQFCFAQNVPGISGAPLFNPSKTRITVQGKDQVTFIVPMTMGTPLAYEMAFSLTQSQSANAQVYVFANLKIRGTWTANEAPLPGTMEANQYVDSARAKADSISTAISNCLASEV